ncbi:MAG TPA: BamA/TamA family outer membrane protein [Rhodothermales bacterium]|nr:BamA/TamA family outer membrane protein [Rhodothermales bacterium]
MRLTPTHASRPASLLGALVLGGALAVGGCAATGTFVAPTARQSLDTPAAGVPDPAYQVFLVGGTGIGNPDDAAPVLAALRVRLREAGEASAVVFLGDQLTDGLPAEGAPGRAEAEDRLRRLAAAVEGYEGRVFVVPGDGDWEGGADAVRRQEAFLEGLLGRDDAFLPGDALAGPLEIELGDDLPVLVALDTPWWFQDADDRPAGDVDEVPITAPGDVIDRLDAILTDRDGENILVVGHHPVFTNGPRAGRAGLGAYLLPPVLGGAVPLYRGLIGGTQDLAGTRYTAFRNAFLETVQGHDGVIYAAGHEHALEAFSQAGLGTRRHFLVSGSAADADAVSPITGAIFTQGTQGFLVVRYGADGESALETVAVSGTDATSAVVAALGESLPDLVDQGIPQSIDPADFPPNLGETVTAVADSNYLAGSLHQVFFGSGYREAWAAPAQAPVLDMGRDYGGLTPLERGGGLQSVSIRFEGGDGHTYQIRLLEKHGDQALPPELQTAVVAGAVRDQTSASNPYGALPASAFATAAGVYHAAPRLYFIPDDPRLGIHRAALGGRLGYVEIRPDDDMSDREEFGFSDDVVSSPKLFEELRADHDHRVDERAFLHARLLDVLMGDWDRHDDQWRWASFEPYQRDPSLTGEDTTRGKVYVPIPRDRDFAFYRIGGLFPGMARFFQAKLQPYGRNYGSMIGLTFNGIPLDRQFLTRLSWADWQAEVASLRAALTPDVVTTAFQRQPPAVYARYGPYQERAMLTRLDHLEDAARRYYALLAQAPEVLGSDEREHFEVTRMPGGQTEVVVRHLKDDGDTGRELFRRTFFASETREIRLYAMGGDDRLVLTGGGGSSPLVRFIGGGGADEVRDEAHTGHVAYYDTRAGNTTDAAGSVTLRLSDAPDVNLYDPFEYDRYAARAILPSVGYDRTDGVRLGAGWLYSRPRFRGARLTHSLSARISTVTGGVAGSYTFNDPDRWGRGHGVALGVSAATPRNVRNFYGFSNESGSTLPAANYRVPLAFARAEVGYTRRLEQRVLLEIGPAVSYTDVHRDTTGFAASPAAGLPANALEQQVHGGAQSVLALSTVDNAVNPRQGVRWTTRGAAWAPLNDAAGRYGTVGSDLAMFFSPSYQPQFTLGLRVGVTHAFGDVPFYDAPSLGGESVLRGFRRERFTGRTAFYQSAELRTKLATLQTPLIPFGVGLYGFFDNGRVWADGESSSVWHQSYGGGLWLGVLDNAVVTAGVGVSEEETQLLLRLGFAF